MAINIKCFVYKVLKTVVRKYRLLPIVPEMDFFAQLIQKIVNLLIQEKKINNFVLIQISPAVNNNMSEVGNSSLATQFPINPYIAELILVVP